MPAAESSLRITEAYRARVFAVRSNLERRAVGLWPTIDGLDDFTWTNKAAAATQQAQNTAVALTGAYLTAFLSSEVGTRTRGPILDTRRYSGLSRDGRPLQDALRSPMIGVRLKLKEGATPEEALAFGLGRAKRMVSVDYDHAHRTALLDGLAADERFQGWQRAVTGTCGACAGDIAVEVSTNLPSIPLQVHPNCQCVTEPVVRDRPQTVARATGQQLFDAKSPVEQDAMLGPEAAAAVREGKVALGDLVDKSKIETADDFITQKPLTEADEGASVGVVETEKVTAKHLQAGDRVRYQPIERNPDGSFKREAGTFTVASVEKDAQGVTVRFTEGISGRGGSSSKWTRERR
jgi:hypothetical protein